MGKQLHLIIVLKVLYSQQKPLFLGALVGCYESIISYCLFTVSGL